MRFLNIVLAATALLPVASMASAQRGPEGDGRGRGGERAGAQQPDGGRPGPQGWGGGGERFGQRAGGPDRAQPGPQADAGPRGDQRRDWGHGDARPSPGVQPDGPRDGWDRPGPDGQRNHDGLAQRRFQPGPAPRFDGRGNHRDWRGDERDGQNWRNDDRGGRSWADNRRLDDRGAWNRTWRNDQRYDWTRYRIANRSAYRLPRYYAPGGWNYGYRRFGIGTLLSAPLWSRTYWIEDPYDYRLPDAYGPYRWVRYYGDALLVDVRTGRVVDVVNDIFY